MPEAFQKRVSVRWLLTTLFALLIIQSAWLLHRHLIMPLTQLERLPDHVLDLRGRDLPQLTGIAPVNGSDVTALLSSPTVVVAFMIPDCPACMDATPVLEQLARENQGRLNVVGVFPEPAARVLDVGAKFPTFVDTSGQLFSEFGAWSVPMFLVASGGRVAHQSVGWSDEVRSALLKAVAGTG